MRNTTRFPRKRNTATETQILKSGRDGRPNKGLEENNQRKPKLTETQEHFPDLEGFRREVVEHTGNTCENR